MSSSGQLENGGGTGGTDTPTLTELFRRHLNPDADSLLGKVDFLGFLSAYSRAVLSSIVLAFIGLATAVGGAFAGLVDTARASLREVLFTVGLGPAALQGEAISVARGEIEAFGLFALPMSAVVGLSAVLVLVAAYRFAVGGSG